MVFFSFRLLRIFQPLKAPVQIHVTYHLQINYSREKFL